MTIPWQAAWHGARRILCIRADSLGPVLMCTPALRALRAAAPERHLTLLSRPSSALALPCIPELDAVIPFAAPWIDHDDPSRPSLAEMAMRLAERAFDAAVIFTSFSQSPLPAATLCHLAGISLRLAACREHPHGLLSHWLPEREREHASRHEVQRQLDLVAAIGCTTPDTRLSFDVDEASASSLEARLDAAGIDGNKPLLVLHPGAGAPARRYPAQLWPALLRRLATDLQAVHREFQLVLTGDASEAAGVAAMIEAARLATRASAVGAGGRSGYGSAGGARITAHSLAGRLTLPELGALLRRARLLVANNASPAHIAAALGTPVVNLYALTTPEHTPWRVAQRVLFHPVPCRGCLQSICPELHHACLAALDPDTIVAAVLDLLAATPQRPAHAADTPLAFVNGA